MKKTILLLTVSLALSGSASAAGYNYEGSRMDSGKTFSEMQTAARMAAASPVEIKGELAPVEKARVNAPAKDYAKLGVTAPPALKSMNAGANKGFDNPYTDPRVIGGGLLVVGAAVLAAVVAPEAAVLLVGGLAFAAFLTVMVAD